MRLAARAVRPAAPESHENRGMSLGTSPPTFYDGGSFTGAIMQDNAPNQQTRRKGATAEGPQRSQTLVRGLEIIDAVADGPATIAEIAGATQLTYSTVHRLVSVLVARRYLKLTDTRGVTLGPRLIELGFAAHSRVDLVRHARPWLEELSASTGDTVHLARLENGEVSYLDKLSGSRAVEISSRVGGRKPVISTGVGKALILDRSRAELAALYQSDRHLMNHPVPQEVWLERLGHYQEGGFAFDLGEDEASIRCVAAPVRDATGRIVAAISVSSTTEHMSGPRMQSLIAEVKSAASRISAGLGHRSPDRP
ncbi:IclR family transcriptional regulator [Paracoccus shandongensis]|uniref:IclR family transcriptional regulator n=1 Tax=Paracoccus shandongensis TaxID=2816048 RepID=UPI001F47CDB5|nr:IclR family transcriptional regulator [Paracoccus shandongensis]